MEYKEKDDNLEIYICKKSKKKFELHIGDVILMNDRKILEYFVVLFSYLKSKYLIIEEVLMVKKGYNVEFRNMNFLLNFSYIDFKIWLIKSSNLNDSQSGSSLFDFEYEKEIFFEFSVVEGSLNSIEKNLGKIENVRPKKPLLRQEILKEVLGEYEELTKYLDE